MDSAPTNRFDGAFERALFGICILAPACMAAAHAMNVADAAHDEAVVRVVGLGWTGAFRALDVALGALFAWLPLGTRAFRAGLTSAAACGLAGGVLFSIARRVLASCAVAPRLGPAVAAIASATATLSVGWQLEAGAPGGSVLGAILALAPLAIVLSSKSVSFASPAPEPESPRAAADLPANLPLAGFAAGLALSYEPLLGAMALSSVLAVVALPLVQAHLSRRDALRIAWRVAIGVALGLVPLLASLASLARTRAGDGLALAVSAVASPLGEHGASTPISPLAFVRGEIGYVEVAFAFAGIAVAALVPRARPLALAMVVVVAIGLGGILLGAPAGPTRYAGPVLAAIAAVSILAGIAMQALVRAVANAELPFAGASASMIVLLEAAMPVRAADEAATRVDERERGAAATWDEVAWGALPPASVLLLNDRRLLPRIVASRASGELRGDLLVVPTFDLAGAMASRALAREPKLGPFWRDMALSNAPDEFSLSSLAVTRPVVTAYDSHWERSLSRHLVPVGLVARFEPEPRGPSDRRRALETQSAGRIRLEKAIVNPPDPELMAASANLLRARVIGLVATGERDLVAHGLDDLRPFAPTDRVAGEIVRRVVMAKGVVDVKDLSP